jgi:uncharacterized surface anchored protein
MIAHSLLMLMTAFASPQGPAQASIEGIVVDAGTDQPIPDARVSLTRSQGAVPSVTTTNREGQYALSGLDAGGYRVTVAAEGYARQEYGHGQTLTLSAGQPLKDIRVRMTATGTVTGYIRDSAGQPAVGVQIQLVSPTYGPGGERRLAAAAAARTNDRGEYRMYWVTPGRYYLVAGSLDTFGGFQSIESRGFGGSPNEYQAGGGYGITFHPGVPDPEHASFVTVPSGRELKIDLVVREQLYRVRGRVVDARSGRPPSNVQLTLVARRMIEGVTGLMLRSMPRYNPADGTFEVRDVPPGLYYLNASASRPIPIEVSGSDVDGVVVTVEPYISIPGRVSLDGQEISTIDSNRVRIFLNMSAGGRRLVDTSFGAIGGMRAVQPDGTFTLTNVMPGEYRLFVLPLPDYFIKDAQYNGHDVLNKPLVASSSTAGTLTIVLSSKTGTITATVVDAKLQPVAASQVVLIPDAHRDRYDLYKTATTDAAGHATIAGVAPGSYKLFAWEALEPYAYYDPKILEVFEQQGTPVRVEESSTASADVKLIPAS